MDRPSSAHALGAAAIALLLAAIGTVVHAAQPRAGSGWTEVSVSRTEGACAWDAPGRAASVREPMRLGERAAPGCTSWRSFYVARRRARLQLVLESTGSAEVLVDGEPLVTLEEGRRRAAFDDRELEPGLHEVEVRLEHRGGAPYLRLFALDLREPFLGDTRALDPRDWAPTREDATRALRAPRADDPARALAVIASLALAGLLAWMALRVRDRAPVPMLDVALAIACVAVAGLARIPGSLAAELLWDELSYVNAGEHYVRNVIVGDWTTQAWRWNLEHPPNAKWLMGLGTLLGGLAGARVVCASLATLAVGFVYAIARSLVSRGAAVVAALLLAITPQAVGLERLCSLETAVVFFWCGAMLAAARWMVSAGILGSDGPPARGRDGSPLAAFLAGACAVLGTASRATTVWVVPLLLLAIALVAIRRGRWRWIARVPPAAIAGSVVAVALTLALWPWLWPDPIAQFSQAVAHFTRYRPGEHFLGTLQVPPPRSYFVLAFLETTPPAHLALGTLGVVLGIASRKHRLVAIWLTAALLLPFAQSISHVRQDLARYVIQAWAGLALAAGLGAHVLADWIRAAGAPRGLRAIGWAPAAIAIALGAASLAAIEPYPTVYFSPTIGGVAGVARTHRYEVAGWGEGLRAACAWLDANAPEGATFVIDSAAFKTRPRLRDDLVEIERPGRADFAVRTMIAYELEQIPRRCAIAHEVTIQGAPLARVFDCRPRSDAAE